MCTKLVKHLKTRLPVNRFSYLWADYLHCIIINTLRLFKCVNLLTKVFRPIFKLCGYVTDRGCNWLMVIDIIYCFMGLCCMVCEIW